MAAPVLLPSENTVYRGLSNANWHRNGVFLYKAFMLRPASARYPREEQLSLGLSPESAIDELREHHGTAALMVLAVHALPHHLRLYLDPKNSAKAEMHGLPLFSTDETQRGLAIAIATDLAGISRYAAVNPAN